ncbi:hypothetical protein T484DRAFT_1800795, partial [Baffinella frigidus]
ASGPFRVGLPFPAFSVTATDFFGNRVPWVRTTAVAYWSVGCGNCQGSVLTGTTEVTADDGLATFPDLSTEASGTFSLSFFFPGTTGRLPGEEEEVSYSFSVMDGVPTTIEVCAHP